MLNQIQLLSYKDLLPKIGSGTVDVVITDPPFGVDYQNYTKNKHAKIEGDEEFFSYGSLASECFRILKPDTAFFSFVEVEGAGFQMREPVLEQKSGGGTGNLTGSFQNNVDWCLFASKGNFHFRKTQLLKNKQAGKVQYKNRPPTPLYKNRFPSGWFGHEFPSSSENSSFQHSRGIYHPTIKGLEFIKWLIQLSTDEGDTVCDPFIGSGTTAVACLQTNRNFVGCELNPDHYATALRRVESRL